MKARGVCMKDITIRENANGKSIGVYSLTKHKYIQGEPSETVISCETNVVIDKNQVVAD